MSSLEMQDVVQFDGELSVVSHLQPEDVVELRINSNTVYRQRIGGLLLFLRFIGEDEGFYGDAGKIYAALGAVTVSRDAFEEWVKDLREVD